MTSCKTKLSEEEMKRRESVLNFTKIEHKKGRG